MRSKREAETLACVPRTRKHMIALGALFEIARCTVA